eukprot:TRINITY_DN26068_c0_g1_i2.p1 TRINITY_DN26068_c0_g1~~TRINITY_DN26068_c0_g1_i2.p1  ORF type:complete len:108 (+),score=18.72 TRINITY_DN26068_c0_g1_i2:92-415(+)
MKRPCPESSGSDVEASGERSVLTRDLAALYQRARDEEQEGKHASTDCKVVIGGSVFYAHSPILIMRSGFFEKALLLDMREAKEKKVELSHAGPDVPKDSVLALLRFV